MSAAVIDHAGMRFAGHTALQDVTAEIAEDAITGLLGRNGAGKTTLMQLLTGHRVPTSGQVRVFGESPFENEGVLRRVCFVKESQRYPDQFRVRDAVDAAARLFPRWDGDLARDLLADFDLPLRRPVKKLSRGMTSAVGIVIGLASRAELTFFDEPYLGLDAVARQLFYDRLLADYADHPRTVVLSTHLIEEVGDLLEHVLLLDQGRLVLAADADGLRETALTVSGSTAQVEAFSRGRQVLRLERMAGRARAVVRVAGPSDAAVAGTHGLLVEPTPLQQLVVAMSHRPEGAPASAPTAPARLTEVS